MLKHHLPDVEIVSVEGVEIVIPEVGGIDTDVLLTIKDDILREKLLNVNLLIANIEALKDNPTPSSDVMTKSSSTSLNLFLEETNTFDNSSPEPETFRFNLEEISSGSPTTHSELSLPDDKAFYVDNDHFKEKSSGSTTTHVDFSQYDSFIFDLSNDHFPPADRKDDIFTLAYVVWIFLAFLTYPVVPPYLLSTGNEDTIFDSGISIYHSFMPEDFPDCEDSRARSFDFRVSHPQLHFGNPERISHKKTKNQAKSDKTGHGMEKCVKTNA
ncbi:hypothetical protein Tco_0273090 [Tanacetum coccineum]